MTIIHVFDYYNIQYYLLQLWHISYIIPIGGIMAIKLIDSKARFEIVSQLDEAVVNEPLAELLDGVDTEGKPKYKPGRFSKYMDTLSLSDLKLDETKGAPTLFVVRCLTDKERAELQEKHLVVNTEKKTMEFKNQGQYLIDCFDLAITGIKNTDGSIQTVTSADVGFTHAQSVGGTISYMTSIGKHLKNV